jgi:stage II sporulation protein M
MNRAVLVNHYQQIWRDIMEARRYIFVAILIFVAGILSAIVIPSLGERLLSLFLEYLKTFKYGQKDFLGLLIAIFLQNALSAFFAIVFGFFFGLVPIFGAVVNGIAMGAVLNLNPLNFFKLLPHGLFELPAMFITWGLGIWCAGGLFHAPTIAFRIKRSLNIYLSIIVPLLIIAAIVEVLGIKILLTSK